MLIFRFFFIKTKVDGEWIDLRGTIDSKDFIDEGENGDVYFYADDEIKEDILNYQGHPLQLFTMTFDDDENQLDIFVIRQFDKWTNEGNKIVCLSPQEFYKKIN
ncbi:hypothetical protein [Sporolactobacillus putidus]|uniref:Uncharacterized protein n=1 Tax=Sporolactobacillus putidus TaxID=492735 RepID=A0A917S3W6_9BACL|nr:hypothetical protein [Sporolactobacillus putidus]GGL55954.1 hypothetical protein GCM10007968_20070 [Sporolactobacillus putidus]